MFTGHGYRPYTIQKVALGAERSGKLSAIIHEAVHNTSTFEEFSDATTNFPRQVYACPNLDAPLKITDTDLNTPTWMRAPGAVSGMFALECAMDELAYALEIDPLELRLINYAEKDPESGKPFSSKALRECYRLGAEKFGWKDRKPEPRSMRDGRLLVGWGMATGVWGAFQMPATARITLKAAGTAHVASATSDIGPGTYTVITMIAAEYLGLRPEQVKFELGDTKFPRAPSQGGSWTTSSVGSAVYGAALAVGAKLLSLANQDAGSPLKGVAAADVEMLDGRLRLKSDPSRSVSVSDVMKRNRLAEINETFEARPSEERKNYATLAHGAQFVEVKVDPDLGIIRVTRAIEVTAWESRAWGSSGWSASRRPSPTPSSTPRADASGICRSRRTNCCSGFVAAVRAVMRGPCSRLHDDHPGHAEAVRRPCRSPGRERLDQRLLHPICRSSRLDPVPGTHVSHGVTLPSGGTPRSHFLHGSLKPIMEARPSGVMTQGRLIHGGLCRTCWKWPHSSSATQSFLSSW